MIIVPYIHSSKPTKVLGQDAVLHVIKVLCDKGGAALWEEIGTEPITVETLSAVILEPNELVAATAGRATADSIFVEIDPVATAMSSMYSYEEIEPGTTDILCWRTFYHVTGTAGEPLLTPPVMFAGIIGEIVRLTAGKTKS